jgi:dolichyl-phosphate beta-glucosyltransferase
MEYEIIVSADGTDGTREKAAEIAAQNPRIRVIGSPQRAGKGRGIREAVKIANGKYIGFSDADNKTPITELNKFLPYLKQGIEAVIGTRRDNRSVIEKKQAGYRQAGSRLFNFTVRLLLGLNGIRDTQCGFKFFQGDAARNLFSRQKIDGYMYDVEILLLARKAGYRIQQVPIRWRDDGDSRSHMASVNIKNVLDIFRIIIGR